MMLPTLPNDARDGESYIRVCLDVSGYGAETKRRSEKPWPKSVHANGKSGTKVLRLAKGTASRSEEHTSELQSLRVISYAVFCLDRKSVV